MQLDDFRALVEGCGFLSEAHHQYGSDGEVGGNQHTDTVMLGEALTQLVQSLLCEPRGTDDAVNAVIDAPGDVVHHRVRMGKVDDHLRTLGCFAIIFEVDCGDKLQVSGGLHSTAHFGAHAATGSEHSDPGHPRPPSDLSGSQQAIGSAHSHYDGWLGRCSWTL